MSLTKKEQAELKDFGLMLRKVRETKGWTLEQAEENGWPSWQHLQKIEAGQKNINFTTIKRLERLFDIVIINYSAN